MKTRRGGAPFYNKRRSTDSTQRSNIEDIKKMYKAVEEGKYRYTPETPEPQPLKSGLTQVFTRPKSPFTGPGPSTAGKRRRTRRVKRRS